MAVINFGTVEVGVCDRFAKGFPEHADGLPMTYGTLTDALESTFAWDAHVVAYSCPTIPRRLAGSDAYAYKPKMVCWFVDVDGPDHKRTPEWWTGEKGKLEELRKAHKGFYAYTTKGGYRIVYGLRNENSLVIDSPQAAARWKASYLAWLELLRRDFGIIGDDKCADPFRLYRLPRVRRDKDDVIPDEEVGQPGHILEWRASLADASPIVAPEPREVAVAAPVDDDRLELAADALVAAWPPRSRHYAGMALCGALAYAGWSSEAITDFVGYVMWKTVGDPELDKWPKQAVDVIDKIARGELVTGWPKLEELMCTGADAQPDESRRESVRGAIESAKKALGMGPAIDLFSVARANVTALPTTFDPGERPTILVSTDIKGMTDQAEAALARLDGVYVRAQMLVHVVRDNSPPKWLKRAANAPVITPLLAARLRELLGEAAVWIKRETKTARATKSDPAPEPIVIDDPAMPPTVVVETLMARGRWRLPHLEGVSDAPVFRPDGTIHAMPGYDPETGIIFDPLGAEFPPVAEAPTRDDARVALAALVEPFCDFPFVAESDRSAIAALILSVVGRAAIDGSVPMFSSDAHTPGSGKTLQIHAASIIAAGRKATTILPTDNADEMRKRSLAIALAGDPVVMIDNVVGAFGTPALAAVLTADSVTDRVLGFSKMATAIIRFVLALSGNNVTYKCDLGRRVVPIGIDPGVANPEDRIGFAHEDLLAYVDGHRPRLVAAALTVLRAFAVAGRPPHGKSAKGSYESWDRLVRGAIIWAGGADPLGGTERIRETSDDDVDNLRTLLASWHSAIGEEPTTASAAAKLAMAHAGPGTTAERDALRLALATCGSKPDGSLDAAAIGYRLRAAKGRIVGGLKLTDAGIDRSGVRRWRVARLN